MLYTYLLGFVFVSSIVVYLVLHLLTAPYGRHARSGWGASINAKLGWFTMELPSVAIPVAMAICYEHKIATSILVAFWLLHYVQRTFIYPILLKPGRKLSVIVLLMGFSFNCINATLNSTFLFVLDNHIDTAWLLGPRFIIGALIFLSGWIINIHSDHILRTLRKPGELGYKIPHKGMHKLVASPNYLGELIEWTGWAIMTWSLPGLAFMLFTFANLVPRAKSNLQWYRKEFPDYPDKRKAIFPYLY